MPASPSTGTPGLSVPSQRINLPKLRPAKIAWAVAAFIIALSAWLLARDLLTDSIVSQGAVILAKLADHPEPSQLIQKIDGQHFIFTGLPGPNNEPHSIAMDDLHTFSWPTAYLFWLVLLTGPARLKRFWWYALLAWFLLWLTQIAFFATDVTAKMGGFFLSQGFEFLFTLETQQLLDKLCRAYQLTLHHLIPFLLYAPVFFLRLREKPPRDAAGGPAPSRNQPCPCGSGKKFKRCCGATGA